jgi:hypothetical protein
MDEIDHFFANLHFIGDGDFLFGVPLGTPSELRARMFAGWKSYGRGLLSMDEVLEKHRASWDFDKDDRTDLQQFVDEIVLPGKEFIFSAIQRFNGAPEGSFPKLGQFAAGAALTRLHTSFTVLALLTRYGYGFESATIARLILEQLAWVYAVRNHEDKSLLDVIPQSSIAPLKELLPWVGKLYGRLSEYSHMKPELGSEYVERYEKRYAVYSRRPVSWSPMLAWVYAMLADAYLIVSEISLPTEGRIAVEEKLDRIEILANRPTAFLVSKAKEYELFDPTIKN